MTDIKVKHVASRDDWKEPKDGSGTWIEYWEKHSRYQLKDFCRDCRKKVTSDNPFVGAHVKKLILVITQYTLFLHVIDVINKVNPVNVNL